MDPKLPTPSTQTTEGLVLKGREAPPSHYKFKIESFSLLSEALDKYSSGTFEVGGYNWKLSIYPSGDKKRDGQDHISIYLEMVETDSLPIGWEVNAIVNLFALNYLEDKYVSLQDGGVKRFHEMKTAWGIPKFIDIETFSKPSNGYIISDNCVFGVEVFIVKSTMKGDCLSMISQPVTFSYTWKFDSFSRSTLPAYDSETFVAGDYKWKLILYPNGCGEGIGNSISLFLAVDNSTLPPNTKLFVKFYLYGRDQINGNHHKFEGKNIFTPVTTNWGSRKFISLSKFEDAKMGYLVAATCIFEAQLTVLGSIRSL
ncbi:Ubiquitin carboxyl-terminal hydrolase 12 [Quillaja saponaria]|uniref:Ubiquitin carboxyl-terminal hydrolase 12 n=1 Tax=Quillaja saponaria TaxID=32244 RepID=A0AAD7VJ77_QUISA|nr:Ubiquitin carboxyl-terminal hydrolase 12 [Quillaja saponaria]